MARTLTTAEHPIELIVKGNVIVPGDGPRLRQCLLNVLANALRLRRNEANARTGFELMLPGFATTASGSSGTVTAD